MQLTDIPDWCHVEVLGGGAETRAAARMPVPLDTLRRMHDASPIAHVAKVIAPVLMFLGAKDRRVPHADGLAYADALRCAPVATLLARVLACVDALRRALAIRCHSDMSRGRRILVDGRSLSGHACVCVHNALIPSKA